MKRIFLIAAICCISMNLFAQSPFEVGDKKIDFTIGVGTINFSDKNRATFDQHLTMEWGIANVCDKFTVGLGFAVNNMYGATFQGHTIGTYDYSYSIHTYGKKWNYSSDKWERMDETTKSKRQGFGEADMNVSREDVDALLVASLHCSPIKNLDTYVRLGVGVGVMNVIYSKYTNLKGFTKKNESYEHSSKYLETTTTYSYDDLAHAKWVDKPKSKVVPSMAAYIGATYYFSPNWGADLQIGLINANFKGAKKGYPNSFGVFALGVSYKF